MATKKKPEAKPAEKTTLPVGDDDSGIIDLGPDADAPEPEGEGEKPESSKKKFVIIAAAAMMLLGGGGGAAAYFLSGSASGHGEEQAGGNDGDAAHERDVEEDEEAEGSHGEEGKDGELPLVDVPAMVVNMRTADGTARYLKIRFMLEAKSASKIDAIKARIPAIIDAYQPFLREMRPEDISGSAAVFRIKEEMLVRATQVVGKGMVKDVLIQDLVQQ